MRILLAPKFKPSLFGEKFPEKVLADFNFIRDELECTNVSFWAAPSEASDTKKEKQGLIATTYPLKWVQRYALFGFSSIDPVIVDCINSNSPLFIDYSEEPKPELTKFYSAVNRAELGRFSISIPIHLSNSVRTVTTFSFAATHNKGKLENHTHLIKCREFAYLIASKLLQEDGDIDESVPRLTGRETAILRGLADGNSYQQIAEILGISRWTVVAHAKSARAKLKAKNNSEAITIALSRSLL